MISRSYFTYLFAHLCHIYVKLNVSTRERQGENVVRRYRETIIMFIIGNVSNKLASLKITIQKNHVSWSRTQFIPLFLY